MPLGVRGLSHALPGTGTLFAGPETWIWSQVRPHDDIVKRKVQQGRL